MSIQLVTARARTKGKTPQNFTFPAVGTLTERKIEGNPEKGVADSLVDDIDVSSLVDSSFDDVAALVESQGLVPEGKNVQQTVMGFLLNGFNIASRRKASPVSEAAPSEDELTPYINAMIEAGILKASGVAGEGDETIEKVVGTLRRAITMTAGLNECSKLEALESSKFGKMAKKAGIKFE